MELVQRIQSFKRNLDMNEDLDAPWYRRKKNMLLGIVAVILFSVLVLFFGGYYAGLAAYKGQENTSEDNGMPDPEPRVTLPLEWEGVCPKSAAKCPKSFQGIPPLILVSLDGFHPSFMDRGFTPTIKNIANCGTHAPYMYPVFPSKTFPNHYSQVTGLYPPSHGIIDNTMFDPYIHKLFKVGQPESLNPYWWLKEPIWVTAQKQGKKSACYYWPGSEVKINNVRPTYFKKYNAKVAFESRTDQILAWLDLPPSSRPDFLTLYVNQPDNALHHYGIKSKQVDEALTKVDRMIERLFAGLQTRNLINCVNVIIMSDHGMSDIDCERIIDISKFINVNDSFNTVGPFGRIRPRGKQNNSLNSEMVSKLSCKNSHMRAYEKQNLPVRLHYADNPRIEPIFLDIDAGWTVITRITNSNDGICSGGAHGYDNMFPDMRAIFLAHGPSFKRNFTMRPFINTEIYEMLAELIDVVPNPNNGTKGSMHYIMTSPQPLLPNIERESPVIAEIPKDENEYNDRVSASKCSCSQTQKQVLVQDIVVPHDLHLPFGTPHSSEEHSSLKLLYDENYINAFNLKYRIPMWSAFTIKEQGDYNKVDIQCWTGDARIPSINVLKCEDYVALQERDQYVLQRPLYPQGFSNPATDQSSFITNSIAKSLNHSKLIEEPFNQMLKRWTTETGELNVVTGPAYNIFATGVKPNQEELMKLYMKTGHLLLPTHIFAIATWCSIKSSSLKSCDPSKLEAHAFLLPNQPYPMNCEPPADFIAKNSARVVDVERLTGISFYTGLPIYDAIRLRTMMPIRLLNERSL